MIEAKCLRIGNWVLIDGKPRKVDGIRVYSKESKNQNIGVDYIDRGYMNSIFLGWIDCNSENIEAIPLTQEILLKCGFECNKSTCFLSNVIGYRKGYIDLYYELDDDKGLEMCLNINYNYEDEDSQGDCVFINQGIKTLHQLQNLIYSLTGKELEVKL